MKQTIDDYILNVLKDLNYKKVIVTGATSGIGLALSRILVFKKAYLIMAVRNVLKGNLLKDRLLEEFPKAKIEVVCLDQGDFKSIDKFVDKITTMHPDYDSLVINAGVFNSNKGVVLDNGYPIVLEQICLAQSISQLKSLKKKLNINIKSFSKVL